MYKSDRNFRIWGYTPSFETLIIRSEGNNIEGSNLKKTVDIEFAGVSFISLPMNFSKIEIIKKGNKYFFSRNHNWYVEARVCEVGLSSWGPNIDRTINRGSDYETVVIQF